MSLRQTTWEPFTQIADQRLGSTYQGLPRIVQDGPIQGGVYYHGGRIEAVTVIPETDPEVYDAMYQAVESRIYSNKDLQILRGVKDGIAAGMHCTSRGIRQLVRRNAPYVGTMVGRPGGELVDLSVFWRAGIGECRHFALAGGWVIERFIEEGRLPGDISVDSNVDVLLRAGHAFDRYTRPDAVTQSDVIIVDPTHGYCGTLRDAREAPAYGGPKWNFGRANELPVYRGLD